MDFGHFRRALLASSCFTVKSFKTALVSSFLSAPTAYLAAFGVVAISTHADAAGFQLWDQNASGLGNAYAGSAAVTENASTVFYNPAGMTQLKDREASFGATLSNLNFDFKDTGSVGGISASGPGGDPGRRMAAPNGYLTWRLSKDFVAGIGFSNTFGLKTEYNTPWIGNAQVNSFTLRAYNINPSLAWQINDTVSVGAGVNWQTVSLEYGRQLAVVATVPPGIPGSTPLLSSMDNAAWGWNAGVLVKLTAATKLGLSYRSSIKHDLAGMTNAVGPVALVNAAATMPIVSSLEMPDTFTASLTHRLNASWELLADVSWTGWSKMQTLDVWKATDAIAGTGTPVQTLASNFRDTWRAALGATYTLNDAWKLKTGIAYDQTPVQSAATRPVWMPDGDRVWLSAGAQWKPTTYATLDVGVSRLIVKDTNVYSDQISAARGRVEGQYENSGWILGAQLSFGL